MHTNFMLLVRTRYAASLCVLLVGNGWTTLAHRCTSSCTTSWSTGSPWLGWSWSHFL